MKRAKLKRVKDKESTLVEAALWNKKMSSQFKGCEMLGRMLHRYMPGYIYIFDIGSRFDLVGARYPDGAVMILHERIMGDPDFEEGTYRVDWHKKRSRKGIFESEGNKIERVSLNRPIKKEKLNGRQKKIRTKI